MWVVVISVCSAFTLLTVVMFCLCWKKKRQKHDWIGLDGMVTQKNPDENVNHLPSITVQTVPDGITYSTGDSNDPQSRLIAPNNTRRSLPDIPSEGPVQLDGVTVVYEPNGDNSSELYATVEPYQNSVKVSQYHNGIESRPSISQHSSISQADDAFSPYARVNYDKLKKPEHPYASVQSTTSKEPDESNSDDATPRAISLTERPSTSQNADPVAPPRSRRSSAHSSITGDIPAASAVAGGIAASQELPYMTPPIIQPNFSGDSQDSSKGYTSISVREPLANIRAQTKEMNKNKQLRELDPHYSTVSDDSDEMYTTIQDPNQVYTSGSETYAQIQPVAITVAVEVNPIPASMNESNEEDERRDDVYEPAPQPPSVDSLKHVAHSHSRQASSSSSIANLGSPKPEKRQANSPLPPPPPTASPDQHANQDKTWPPKNLDEMYAKVQKNKKKIDRDEVDAEPISDNAPSTSNSQLTKRSSIASLIEDKSYNDSSSCSDMLPLHKEHNYETLKKTARKCSDPGYEKLKLKDEDCGSEPGYASINGPASLISSDPGYEVLKQSSLATSDTDPNYEELRHRTDSVGYSTISEATISQSQGTSLMDGYSVVNKQRKSDDRSKTSSSFETDSRDLTLDEPNYESMPSETASEHNYAALKSNGSESDPNYESVNHNDPSYESMNHNDPNYESMSQNDPNYESVKYSDFEDPPYEHLRDDDEVSKTDSEGYSKIKKHEYENIETRISTVEESLREEPPYERLLDEELSKTESDSSGYEKIRRGDDYGETSKNGDDTCDSLVDKDVKIKDVEDSNIKETTIKEPYVKGSNVKEFSGKEYNSKESVVKVSNIKESNCKESDSKDSNIKEPFIRDDSDGDSIYQV